MEYIKHVYNKINKFHIFGLTSSVIIYNQGYYNFIVMNLYALFIYLLNNKSHISEYISKNNNYLMFYLNKKQDVNYQTNNEETITNNDSIIKTEEVEIEQDTLKDKIKIDDILESMKNKKIKINIKRIKNRD